MESVPIVSGKPYLAMDGHVGSIRVLLTMETMATYESSRLGKFLADEQVRHNEEMRAELEEVEEYQEGVSPDQSTLRRRSASDPILPGRESGKEKEGLLTKKEKEVVDLKDAPLYMNAIRTDEEEKGGNGEGDYETDPMLLERSMTPLLPDPSTIALEESMMLEENPVVCATGQGAAEEATRGPEANVPLPSEEVDDDDYNSDELEAKAKFGKGVRAAPPSNENIERAGGDRLEVMPQAMDESFKDSGDYTIPDGDLMRRGSGHVLYGNVTEVVEESPYSNPRELDMVNFESKGADDGVYSVPHELDALKQFPPLQQGEEGVGPKREGEYDFPAELLNHDVHPYEDPATLTKGK